MMEEEEEAPSSVLELDISDGPKKVIEMLTQDNHAEVEKVYLSRAFPSPRRAVATDKSVAEVLDSIVALPKINHLSVGYASGSFPIHLLMKALTHKETIHEATKKSSISKLVLLGVKLTPRESKIAAETIRQARMPLRAVSLESCKSDSSTSASGTNSKRSSPNKPLDVFLGALSTIPLETLSLKTIPAESMHVLAQFPLLKELSITHMKLSEESLENIGRSKQLEKLELETITEPKPNQLLQILSRILIGNTILRFLKWRDIFTESRVVDTEALAAFCEMLQHNNSLHELRLVAKFRDALFGYPIGNVLRYNSTLIQLHIQTKIDPTEKERTNFLTSMVAIAESLRFNGTLKSLSFHLSGGMNGQTVDYISHTFMAPFLEVLREDTQFVLEYLTFEYRSLGKLALTAELEFYLHLNRIGRRKLLTARNNTTQRDWIDMLVDHRDDISVIFYFLMLNPPLCQAMALERIGGS